MNPDEPVLPDPDTPSQTPDHPVEEPPIEGVPDSYSVRER